MKGINMEFICEKCKNKIACPAYKDVLNFIKSLEINYNLDTITVDFDCDERQEFKLAINN